MFYKFLEKNEIKYYNQYYNDNNGEVYEVINQIDRNLYGVKIYDINSDGNLDYKKIDIISWETLKKCQLLKEVDFSFGIKKYSSNSEIFIYKECEFFTAIHIDHAIDIDCFDNLQEVEDAFYEEIHDKVICHTGILTDFEKEILKGYAWEISSIFVDCF